MPSVLILYRSLEGVLPTHIGVPLTTAGFTTCSLPFTVTSDELCQAFPHGIADLVVADLGSSVDIFALRHYRQVVRETWGNALPLPPLMALLSRSHFYEPDLRLLIDDFLLPPYDPTAIQFSCFGVKLPMNTLSPPETPLQEPLPSLWDYLLQVGLVIFCVGSFDETGYNLA